MKKLMVVFSVVIISLVSFIIWSINKKEVERIQVHGISTFNPASSENGNHFLLFYPRDERFSQENTIVKEVDYTGEIIREYEVIDQDFRRMIAHQKPNQMNQLYISFFGEATIDNYYFTYDIDEKKFEKVILDYFDYDVGVDHILHYGNHTLFQTLVSHKTGDQNLHPETYDFNMSISDYDLKQSFETEYGYAPKWSPLLGFHNKLIYATAGRINDKDEYENSGIGLIDLFNQQVEYETFNNDTEFFPLYASDKHAYVLSNSGELYVYDTSFNYKTYEPFKNLPKQDWYYSEENSPLLIDGRTILTSVYSEDKGSIVGLIELEPEPVFTPLEKSYLESNYIYKFLYQDIKKEEIYVLQKNNDETFVLVIDHKTFERKERFPVEYGHMLDFVRPI